ncbi:hypothetical protein DVH24_017851 [Malus domestica]|uniref:Uncharacterized protein n=1 Tax=Malus domestica TaxID=3750 RepID=A0A498KCB3_MALDO|nr:hypothetical protein DVH24_017851 [Malus domestica]
MIDTTKHNISFNSSHVIIRLAETENRDRELLIPVADYGDEDASSKPSSSSSSSYRTGCCDPISSSDHYLYGGASCTIGSRRGSFLHQKDAKKFGSKRRSFEVLKNALKNGSRRDSKQKEAIDKKVDKIQKVTSVIRNSPETDIVKSKNVSKCPEDLIS